MESGRDKDMKRKITVFALNAMLFALSFSAEAQQANIPRLGFLRSVAADAPCIEAFRRELKKLGYVEGENIVLEYRSGKPDQLPKPAAQPRRRDRRAASSTRLRANV